MTGKPRDGTIKVLFPYFNWAQYKWSERFFSVPTCGHEDYFAYYYAYAEASGKLLHARKTPHP